MLYKYTTNQCKHNILCSYTDTEDTNRNPTVSTLKAIPNSGCIHNNKHMQSNIIFILKI